LKFGVEKQTSGGEATRLCFHALSEDLCIVELCAFFLQFLEVLSVERQLARPLTLVSSVMLILHALVQLLLCGHKTAIEILSRLSPGATILLILMLILDDLLVEHLHFF
jgi:hypothetical protein